MAYKVGQIRQLPDNNNLNTTNNNYYQVIQITATTAETKNPYNESTPFSDFALSGSFERNKVYFLRVIIGKTKQYSSNSRSDYNNQLEYSLKLKNSADDTGNEQVVSNFTVSSALSSYDDEFYTYSLIFTPNANYNLLIFELQKIPYDYINEPRTWKSINYETDGGIVCELKSINSKVFSKIGFQSRPGELIAINGFPIRVGRSGIYELDNGTPISRIMIAPNASNQIDAFLLDYMYNDSEEEEV